MKSMSIAFALLLLAGCGAEVAQTAATGASIKKQEMEAAKAAQEAAQKKIDAASQQMQQGVSQRAGDAAK